MANHHQVHHLTKTRSRSSAASQYDGVPSFTPSEQDYIEIFGGFRHGARGSAIPVLDLPPLEDGDVAVFDFRLIDYSEVFGGFDGLDCAVPFEELFRPSPSLSDEGCWIPVKTECFSEEWDASPHSSKTNGMRKLSNRQFLDDGKQFEMSYHRRHETWEEDVSKTRLAAPQQVVPEHAFMVDQVTPLQQMQVQSPKLHESDGTELISRGKRAGGFSRQTASLPAVEENGRRNVQSVSHPRKFVTISEINLKTQPLDLPPPPRPPPTLDAGDGSPSETASSHRATSIRRCSLESTSGDDSPLFFDVEVVASSSAAASASVKQSQAEQKNVEVDKEKEKVVPSQVSVSQKDDTRQCAVSSESCNFYEDQVGEAYLAVENFGSISSAHAVPTFDGVDSNLTEKKKSKQSVESYEAAFNGEWGEVPEFFELVRTDKNQRASLPVNGENSSGHDGSNRECGEEEKSAVKQEKKINQKFGITMATNKLEDHTNKSNAATDATSHLDNQKGVHKYHQKPYQCEELEKKVIGDNLRKEEDICIEILQEQVDVERKELNTNGQNVQLVEKSMGEANLEVGVDVRNGNPQVRICETRNSERQLKESSLAAATIDDRILNVPLVGQDDMNMREDCSCVCLETDKRKTFGRKESESQLRTTDIQVRYEIWQEAHIKEQTESEINTNMEQEEQEACFRQAFEREENAMMQKEAFEKKEEQEKQLKAETERKNLEKDETERRRREEEYVTLLMEASENEAEEMLKEALEEVNKRILMEDFEKAERERKMKNETEERQNQVVSDTQSESKDKAYSEHAKDKKVEGIKNMHQSPNLAENGRSLNLTPESNTGTEDLKVFHSARNLIDDIAKGLHAASMVETEQIHSKLGSDKRRANVETFPGSGINNTISAEENSGISDTSNESSNAPCEAVMPSDQIGIRGNNTTSRMAWDSRHLQSKAYDGKVSMQEKPRARTQGGLINEVYNVKDELAQKGGANANAHKSVSTKSHLSDGGAKTKEPSQPSKSSLNMGKKEKNETNNTAGECDRLERFRREAALETERLRKLEEEREREREREKDGVAFESVTRNFRESAYTDVHERAGRAAMDRSTADARQRLLTEARERLERACEEAKDKACLNNVSMEARMRQDRAAAEKATVEALDPTFGNVMAQKDASGTREHTGTLASSSSAKYGSTTISNDKSGEIEGESARRCQSRLERHQRTAERTAKALAEKKTRDLIAQREQAERHRLAESLDVQVKRWSNGKEGNLRALLSTLQYILGPESGWQPVPLTGIITSVAVKKAYRKATLCVHPDKLQQRQATIQQKYICEKVFDLLKEAWNRFNSEER